MNKALRNLLAITLAVVTLLIITGIWLRARAYSKHVKEPLGHSFLQAFPSEKPLLVAHRGGWAEAPENTIEAFDRAHRLDSNLVFWVDVRPTRDSTLVAFRERDLSHSTEGKGWIGYTPDTQVEQLDAGFKFRDEKGEYPFRGKGLRIPKLAELLARYPERRWILNFHDYRPGMAEKVVELVENAKAGDRSLIASPEDGFLRDMREKKPMWLFGTSQAQGTRLKMLDSIGLAPVVTLLGDVFVLESAMRRPSLYEVSDSIVAEIHRRKMKLIIGPVSDHEDLRSLTDRGIDGVLLAAPTKVLSATP